MWSAGCPAEAGLQRRGRAQCVDLCGTRLRLLEAPLTRGEAQCSTADFLSSARDLGAAAYANIFCQLSKAEAAELAKLLDSIEACEAALEGRAAQQAAAPSGAAAEGPLAESLVRPVKEMLPAALRHVDVAPILLVNRKRELLFQSQLLRRCWAQLRLRYAAHSAS